MQKISYNPIGIIHTPFKEPEGTPIQPKGAKGVEGTVEVFNPFLDGLLHIDGFSHLILIYHFHRSRAVTLQAIPFLDNSVHGIFAIRAPGRPNPIGLSVVQLIAVKDNLLYIQDVDIVDKTPLLDIKPYVPSFDVREVTRVGWLEGKVEGITRVRDDGRFTE
jgi:tRNA-Thr(GGU) m(6)t(6)A37 methyltransferase TsaA